MTGVPGRSGKVTTAEDKAVRAEAGRKGMASRYGKTNLPPPTATDPTSDNPVERLGKPVTWGDELKRQQVEGERIQNRRREVEVQRAEVELAKAQEEHDQARGKLMTKDQHRDAVGSIVGAIVESSSSLLTAAVSLHPPEQQPMARHQFEQALAAWRIEAMKRIKAG